MNLKDFLVSKGAWGKYCVNVVCSVPFGNTCEEDFMEDLDFSFLWGLTIQGYEYWCKLYDEFIIS